MSEFESDGGRRGLMRDVMRRISPNGPGNEDDDSQASASSPGGTARSTDSERGQSMARSLQDEIEDLREALRFFGGDSAEFRRRLDRLLAEYEAIRRRFHLTRDQLTDAERQNEKLVGTLQEAKQQMELLKEEVDKLCAPPNGYGVYQRSNKDDTAEIVVDGKSMRVNVHPNVDTSHFEEGQLVVLNEAFNIVEGAGFTLRGEIMSIVENLGDGRVIVLGHTDDERVVTLSDPLRRERLKAGDHVLVDPRTQYRRSAGYHL